MPTQSLIWKASGHLLATPADRVLEVLPPVRAEPLREPPDFVRGTFVHRGKRLGLLDAASLLGQAAEPDRMSNRVLVLRVRQDAVGLWVSAVLDLVVSAPDAAHVATPWGDAERADPELLVGPDRLAVLSLLLREVAA